MVSNEWEFPGFCKLLYYTTLLSRYVRVCVRAHAQTGGGGRGNVGASVVKTVPVVPKCKSVPLPPYRFPKTVSYFVSLLSGFFSLFYI